MDSNKRKALQAQIKEIQEEGVRFAKFNTYFMNHRTYEAELNKNEKR